MTVLKYQEMLATRIQEGMERRLGHTENLMIVIVDFHNGPKDQPDPPHSHPHEQVSYVAEGEIYLFMDDQQTHLEPGDVFLVPSGIPHTVQPLSEHVRLIDCFTPIRADFIQRDVEDSE